MTQARHVYFGPTNQTQEFSTPALESFYPSIKVGNPEGFVIDIPKGIRNEMESAIFVSSYTPSITDTVLVGRVPIVAVSKRYYRNRLAAILVDAADESQKMEIVRVTDFLRFVRDSSVITSLPKPLMGATPFGGITVSWRSDGHKLSVTFVGSGNAIAVWLDPDNRARSERIDCDNLDGIISDTAWLNYSPPKTTWQSTPA